MYDRRRDGVNRILRTTKQKNKVRFHYTLYVRNVRCRDELRHILYFINVFVKKDDAFLRTVDKDLERGRCL